MRKLLSVILILMMVLPTLGQSGKAKYQSGTVTSVKAHQERAGGDPSVKRFDMSIKVGSTVYVVLYTPPPGTYANQDPTGMDFLVLVGEHTITFNNLLGISREVPILSRSSVPQPNNH